MTHTALNVAAPWQTGVAVGQSAFEPEPALPEQTGVTQSPLIVLQTWPWPHWVFMLHSTTSVAVLVEPSLIAVIVSEPRASGPVGVHVQMPIALTVAVQTVAPPTDTVTVWPGIPVPVMAGVVEVVSVV